ncbi:pilus assembly protein PilZ [Sphingomonas spermidinifaciens]|uniref:Pilus assembly protein PilZ n=1 Tax=Sphingomonas spermidinifaciens TaxID=1141889 RepID=A0A2A4B4Z6_9SPHN|nr:PilZ domain-containing protein [Sphingomonas spermidinifaciens]PCD03025.1 pilus assembly protein PilZ [Sphingomonas spermidinifaciens]
MESHVPVRTRIAAELIPLAAGESRRAAARKSVSLDAGLFDAGYHGSLCRITDLSMSGARIQTFTDLVADTSILLTLPGGVRRVSRVVWSRDYQAGCQFEQPLSNFELELLTAG